MWRSALLLCLGLAVAAGAAPALPGSPLPASYGAVAIAPARTSIYIGFVTLATDTFARRTGVYEANYSASVFPYFFWSEKGRISIRVPDAALRRLQGGEAVDFEGTAVSEAGETRRITGHAVPADAAGGAIKVRVFVTRRIVLSFNSSYRLAGGI